MYVAYKKEKNYANDVLGAASCADSEPFLPVTYNENPFYILNRSLTYSGRNFVNGVFNGCSWEPPIIALSAVGLFFFGFYVFPFSLILRIRIL